MKNIVKIFYGLLVVALGISIFCVSMISKNNGYFDQLFGAKEAVNEKEATIGQNENGSNTPAFDSILQGTGNLESKNLNINGVPCILYYTDNYEMRPVMMIQHGLTSKKEDMKDLANAFAQQGYLVVTPDAAAHGELTNQDSYSLAELIQQTSKDFDIVLDYLAKSSYVDMERIGMAGISLGGLSTLHYVKNGSYDPKVVVTMCATPKYEDLAGTTAAYNYMVNGNLVAETDAAVKVQLDEDLCVESPYEAILTDNQTNYYLLCGDQDDVVPYQGNVELYEAKKASAADMILQVKEGQGHTVTEDDLWEILTYVVAHL